MYNNLFLYRIPIVCFIIDNRLFHTCKFFSAQRNRMSVQIKCLADIIIYILRTGYTEAMFNSPFAKCQTNRLHRKCITAFLALTTLFPCILYRFFEIFSCIIQSVNDHAHTTVHQVRNLIHFQIIKIKCKQSCLIQIRKLLQTFADNIYILIQMLLLLRIQLFLFHLHKSCFSFFSLFKMLASNPIHMLSEPFI